MTPRQRQIYDVVQRLGSKTAAAKELEIDKAYVRRAYAAAEAWLNADGRTDYRLDPAIKNGMETIGTNMVPALAWAKIPPKDGEIGYSLMLRPEAEPPEAVAERIRAALEGMVPAEPVVACSAVLLACWHESLS